jgi:dipeptidase E
LLLASAGIKNGSIENALVERLGKPIARSAALAIPTTGDAIDDEPPITVVDGKIEVITEVNWRLFTAERAA